MVALVIASIMEQLKELMPSTKKNEERVYKYRAKLKKKRKAKRKKQASNNL